MKKEVPLDIVEKWLKAWSLSRELPLPIKYKSGFMVDVGYENQKRRYVFQELNDDFIQLLKTIDEPNIFLKVCTSPNELKAVLSKKWIILPQGYMMACFHKMVIPKDHLNEKYKLEFESYNSTFVVRIVSQNGELASIGRVVLVDDLAIYDRISTEANHRRNGLASFLMKELEKIALANGVHYNFLVATEEGKLFYQSLGWELYSLYTSVVIN
ncbi:GNAT family N-acetyltransferase [Flavobacterium sp. LS1R49]|uniref:GNAT family N-acetyltransferase n=1 Tax=Flavobacterium shii TaxID=2987687 RepID=A0A9X3C5S0_9FLAO|nr:GNAT family N-acetyltransferase [Flavobacterium shii]MCV9927897.1 GNAT family N-acetyltransferase [Flavobacterium shii]